MNRDIFGGLVLSSAGAIVVALGVLLVNESCGVLSLSPTGVVCTMPRWVAEWAYFLASGGGALAVIGISQTGIWRKRIVSEGGWLVIAIGTVVSTLGFLASNLLPEVSTASAEIGYLLGVIGSGLLAGGVLKTTVGQTILSTENSAGTVLKKPHWSTGEQAGAVILVSILILLIAFTGLILYDNYNPQPCCTLGPAKEVLSMESYTFNSPTNVPLNIRNVGFVSATLANYYVKDSAGDQYRSTNWVGPVALPNALIQANVVVDGNAVMFQPGNAYTITVITFRNNQFTFTIG